MKNWSKKWGRQEPLKMIGKTEDAGKYLEAYHRCRKCNEALGEIKNQSEVNILIQHNFSFLYMLQDDRTLYASIKATPIKLYVSGQL